MPVLQDLILLKSQASTMPNPCDISVVVPVYKEEGNIIPFLQRIEPILEQIGSYEIIFSMDPSPDNTETIIRHEMKRNSRIGLLTFSRRFGQPSASIAGILNCRGAFCAVIDVDLQDPPELIKDMYAKSLGGFDVVYARRRTRAGETLLKKIISEIGYKVINSIAHVQIPRNTGDFRIISRRVIEELRLLPESHGFLRGLVALVGFKQTFVDYDRQPRLSGTGNYNRLTGSFKIGFNGLFGFSSYPLSLMLWSGFIMAGLSTLLIISTIASKFLLHKNYPLGIPTVTILVLLMGGVQLMSIGILGEYIGRIYDEVRRRPMYIIDQAFNVNVQNSRGPNKGSHLNKKNAVALTEE